MSETKPNETLVKFSLVERRIHSSAEDFVAWPLRGKWKMAFLAAFRNLAKGNSICFAQCPSLSSFNLARSTGRGGGDNWKLVGRLMPCSVKMLQFVM